MKRQAEQTIGDFLGHHRYDPPERDGWYSSYEIQRGIIKELGKRVRSQNLFPALEVMLEANPPIIEDTWMLADAAGTPIIEQQYSHPDQPKGARRFYRILQTSVEYIPPQ